MSVRAAALALPLIASCSAAPMLAPMLVAGGTPALQRAAAQERPEEFEPPMSDARGACNEMQAPYRQKRAYLAAVHDYAASARNEAEFRQAWEQCASDYQARKIAQEDARERADDERRRAAQDALIRRAQEEEAAQRRADAEEARKREEASRLAIGNAAPVEPPPDPGPAPQPAPAPPPKPRKLTAEERRRAAERKAAREQHQREEEQREHDMAAAAVEASAKFCGPAPERSKWDGIYVGLARAYKTIANDPDSIEFVSCTDADLREAPTCWAFSCDVRGKNAFGAKILREVKFRRAAGNWYLR